MTFYRPIWQYIIILVSLILNIIMLISWEAPENALSLNPKSSIPELNISEPSVQNSTRSQLRTPNGQMTSNSHNFFNTTYSPVISNPQQNSSANATESFGFSK